MRATPRGEGEEGAMDFRVLMCAEIATEPVSYTHLDVYKRQLYN